MTKVNLHKVAPVALHNRAGEQRTFRTQPEVDQAWADGWFGPASLLKDKPLISDEEWETKQAMIDAVHDDPRYKGLFLSKRKAMKTLEEDITTFEGEENVQRSSLPKEE